MRRRIDRDAVVDAAFAVVAAHGLEALTVRAIAKRLRVANPALYWHVADKQEIIDLMAARLCERAHTEPRAHEVWDAWLERAAWAFRRALRSGRDGPRIVAAADLSSPADLARLDLGVRALGGA